MIENLLDEIKEDKSIIHPTASVIDPLKFMLEILDKEIIDKLDFS